MRVKWVSEKYMVREDGTIWAVRKKPPHMAMLRGKPPSRTCQYRRVCFGRNYEYMVHQVVATAFHGPCPPGMIVLHWDGNPLNNNAANLRYGTRADNVQDSIRQKGKNGRNHGERHTKAKFSSETVEAIRNDRNAGMKMKDICEKYGCSISYASLVTNGLIRRHDGGIELAAHKPKRRKRPSLLDVLANGHPRL